MPKPLPTIARLREVFDYDPTTGALTWKAKTHPCSHGIKIGAVAGTLDSSGHRQVELDRGVHMAHRVIWAFVTGAWPAVQIDHRNGVPEDNRLCNLREATHRQNHQNRGNNTSGFAGVSFNKRARKWRAYRCVNYKVKHLGHFDTPEEASAAYKAACARIGEPEVFAPRSAP